MADTKLTYTQLYNGKNFRKNPEDYVIGKGEQGVLMAEPYKSEILPHWRFKTPEIARDSADKIYEMFLEYKKQIDFVGMDMARKFLQMGWTRSRRYANHTSGKKYDDDGKKRPQDEGSDQSPKAESARIFYEIYQRALHDEEYVKMKDN